jgi:molybdopterin-guanine dinucleotide biosynthesis protein A
VSGIAGAILAGGLSTRMGRDKAFVDFRGRPMIAHAIERLAPQVSTIAISANGDPARFASFGLPVLQDVDASRPGPLAGIAAGLVFARDNGFASIVTVPCDAPFAPRDLVARLTATEDDKPAVAMSAHGVEPLFASWPVSTLPAVEAALASGDAAVWRLLENLGARRVAIPVSDGEDWSLNLNSPEDLAAAERAP